VLEAPAGSTPDPTKASYDELTQREGVWDMFVQGMNAARHARLPLWMSLVVTDDNGHEEQVMIDLCESWGVEYEVFTNMTPTIYGGGEVLNRAVQGAPAAADDLHGLQRGSHLLPHGPARPGVHLQDRP
jgi:MoaA/NifB/PqqE/SkfB family radical SAM enzyme